jgi:hypothetical protein
MRNQVTRCLGRGSAPAYALAAAVALQVGGCMTTTALPQCHGPWTAVNASAGTPVQETQPQSRSPAQLGGHGGEH